MAQWDPRLYLKFGSERTQPSRDLVHRIDLDAPRRIIDVGCGPGNSTAELRRRWPGAHITGLDNSPAMIEAARAAYPQGAWVMGDAEAWQAGEPFDLVFANAVLQWLAEPPEACRKLLEQAAPGGALAVQVPAQAHFGAPIYREVLAVAQDPAWSARLDAARAALHSAPASSYYDALRPHAARIDMWETTYYHVVEGPGALLEWYRGTGLRPFLEPLSADERARFERELLARYTAGYPRRPGGEVLFPFERLFFVAYR